MSNVCLTFTVKFSQMPLLALVLQRSQLFNASSDEHKILLIIFNLSV